MLFNVERIEVTASKLRLPSFFDKAIELNMLLFPFKIKVERRVGILFPAKVSLKTSPSRSNLINLFSDYG